MKAILEFNLPDDQYDFDRARLGTEAFSAIHEVLEMQIRRVLKHGDPSNETREILEQIKATLWEIYGKVD
jgi:hypothetical protein